VKIRITGDDGGPIPLGVSGLPEICNFSIPLITIVATFVLELFLPIVVLLFNLFFLLKLKFCFSPNIDLSASVAAELDLSLSLSAELAMQAAVEANIDAAFPSQPKMRSELKSRFSPIAHVNAARAQERAAVRGPESGAVEWEAVVEHP